MGEEIKNIMEKKSYAERQRIKKNLKIKKKKIFTQTKYMAV